MTPPADLIPFTVVRLKNGEELKVLVEPGPQPPLSRPKLLEMILAASLLLEETQEPLPPRLRRRVELLRARMEEAIERENAALEVIASREVIPTVEDAE